MPDSVVTAHVYPRLVTKQAVKSGRSALPYPTRLSRACIYCRILQRQAPRYQQRTSSPHAPGPAQCTPPLLQHQIMALNQLSLATASPTTTPDAPQTHIASPLKSSRPLVLENPHHIASPPHNLLGAGGRTVGRHLLDGGSDRLPGTDGHWRGLLVNGLVGVCTVHGLAL